MIFNGDRPYRPTESNTSALLPGGGCPRPRKAAVRRRGGGQGFCLAAFRPLIGVSPRPRASTLNNRAEEAAGPAGAGGGLRFQNAPRRGRDALFASDRSDRSIPSAMAKQRQGEVGNMRSFCPRVGGGACLSPRRPPRSRPLVLKCPEARCVCVRRSRFEVDSRCLVVTQIDRDGNLTTTASIQ